MPLLDEPSLKRVAEAIPMPCAVIDEHGNVRLLNSAFEGLLGYTLSDIPTVEDWFRLAYPEPDYRQAVVAEWQRRLDDAERTGNRFEAMEAEVCARNGVRYVVLVSTAALENSIRGLSMVSLMDITDRKRTEQTLERNRIHLVHAQRLTHVGSWTWMPETGELIWSDEYYRIIGREPGEFIPDYEHFVAAVHPEDRDMVKARTAEVLARRQPLDSLQFRVVRPDGEVRYVRSDAEFRKGSSGQELVLIGTVLDITEHSLAQKALRESNDRLGYVLEATGDAVWDCDLVTGIVTHNRRWCELLGFSDELLQHPITLFYELIHPDDKARVQDEIEALLRNDHDYAIEFRLRRADGGYLWISDHGRVVARNDAGEPIRLVGALADISARKQMELELLEGQQRLDLALRGSGLGLWDVHLASGVVMYDRRWCEITGYSIDEISPDFEGWSRLVHPDDREAVAAAVAAHLNGDTPTYQSEHRLLHKEGHWVWVLANGRIVVRDDNGKPRRATGTILDISQRKRLANEGVSMLQRIESMLREAGRPPGSEPTATADVSGDSATMVGSLTRRQRQILTLIARGLTSPEIAEKLHIATGTAVSHRRELMRKLNLHSVADVTRFALQHKLLDQ